MSIDRSPAVAAETRFPPTWRLPLDHPCILGQFTTAGFEVSDRVGPKLNDCYGKVTWVGGCSQRNEPWCTENCCNVEMECMNMQHLHNETRRTCFPADELEHTD